MSLEGEIRERLQGLSPSTLQVEDESIQHAGHAGAKEGGHYRLLIVSERFRGLNAVDRHRLIYQSLGDLMRQGIHALAIRAHTPDEFQSVH
jgi:BolA protein